MPTLGALEKAGWHGLQSYCRACRIGAILIWAYLKLAPALDFDTVAARLRCSRCGRRPEPGDVRPYYHDTGHAQGRGVPPGAQDVPPAKPPHGQAG
ncbi:hypothetical protein [Methylobacterium sp. J-070]|uniref:hypothetical protein n=1 Tax=Methylobacterium sp. J-070 TaxID=2836650 RepID=UPI001FB8EF63|nr:hypothetical protein [Methylobacterium sp. J-070]MCJ2050861.1 hypothetical protein [Methylobacterium sp. J-070]